MGDVRPSWDEHRTPVQPELGDACPQQPQRGQSSLYVLPSSLHPTGESTAEAVRMFVEIFHVPVNIGHNALHMVAINTANSWIS